jgi:hypothetical protein
MHTLQPVAFLNELASQGWTDPELAAYAEFEADFTESGGEGFEVICVRSFGPG